MTWHPLVMAIWMADLTAWAIYLGAVWRLMVIVPQWAPGSNDAKQLWRERALDLTSFQGRWIMALQAIAFVFLLSGISNVWPSYVPGAMCGTGVLQAMGAAGHQALIYRGLTLLVLYCWQTVERMHRLHPEDLSAMVHGRLLMLAAPFMVLGTVSFGNAVTAISVRAPVSCCAVVYEQINTIAHTDPLAANSYLTTRVLSVFTFGGALLVAGWGWFQWRQQRLHTAIFTGATGIIILWIFLSTRGLTHLVAPYIYQVLYHPCPWCLFLSEHHILGIPLYGLLIWIGAEALIVLTVRMLIHSCPEIENIGRERIKQSGRRICLAGLLFMVVAAAPILLWRVRFGGWMD